MSKRRTQLHILGDGVTSTSVLVHHCLRNRIELGDHIVDVSDLDMQDFLHGDAPEGAFFMVRVASPHAWPNIMALINSGKPYAYLIDDNFWLLLDQTPLSSFYKNWSVRKTLETAVSGAAVVLCHSRRFRDFLHNFNRRVAVVPAYFDFECLEGLPEHLPDHGERRVGIVANVSRAADLAIIVPAIQSIVDQADEDVFFEFCGYVPPELAGHPKVRYFEPVRDYPTFIRMQYGRNWLLGLAPLQETAFSAYKSNNKFREFGGCRTAAIYSDVTVYRESVVHGRTGWLIENSADAWRKQILAVLADPALARQVGTNARVEVAAHYSIDQVRKAWLSALAPVLNGRQPSRETLWRRIGNLSSKFRRRVLGSSNSLNIATAAGWGRQPSIMREGFYSGQTLFSVEPGDSLVTELRAPIDGAFHWSLLLATFLSEPKGELIVRFDGDGVVPQEWRYADDQISDNLSYPFDVELRAGGAINVRMFNGTDRPLGFYALSPNGSTHFESTGLAFPGRILV